MPVLSVGRPVVLIVDDNEKNLVALRASLESLDAELVCVGSGFDALRELLTRDVAAVVLDMQMPGMSGLEVAQSMKSRERTKHIPILFVTAISRETAWVMKGYEGGAVDYLLKPVEPAILSAKVKVFIDLWQQGRMLELRAHELERTRAAEAEAQRAAQVEQELMAIVGHDIRSPLSVIASTGRMLEQHLQGDEIAARGLRRIIASGERLAELSDLLLDYTRARMGRALPVTLQTTELVELSRSVAEDVQQIWPGKIIASTNQEPLYACVDPRRIRQLLTNLLDNAAKHASGGANVLVNLRREGPSVTLSVHNDGAPIPPDAREHLFEPFTRKGEGTSVASPSVGLGLFIVKAVAEAHGGSVNVESSQALGTTFEVVLPEAAAQTVDDCEPAVSAQA